jgi:hypothetical protein
VTASFALRHGVVWICRSAGVARIAPYDLGGRKLGEGFVIRGVSGRPADVRGIAVDADRRIWAADAGSGAVRAFTAFGSGCGGVDGVAFEEAAAIAVQGLEAEQRLLVSQRGERLEALRLVDSESGRTVALRSRGDGSAPFENLAGVALSGRFAFACESWRSAVQIFRDAEFHFEIAWRGSFAGGPSFVPRAVVAAGDGRFVVAGAAADAGAVFLFDAGGAFVRRHDEEIAESADRVDAEVCGVVVDEGESERGSIALVLDQGGDRVLAFTLDGRCLGAFHGFDGERGGSVAAPDAPSPAPAPSIVRPQRT